LRSTFSAGVAMTRPFERGEANGLVHTSLGDRNQRGGRSRASNTRWPPQPRATSSAKRTKAVVAHAGDLAEGPSLDCQVFSGRPRWQSAVPSRAPRTVGGSVGELLRVGNRSCLVPASPGEAEPMGEGDVGGDQ